MPVTRTMVILSLLCRPFSSCKFNWEKDCRPVWTARCSKRGSPRPPAVRLLMAWCERVEPASLLLDLPSSSNSSNQLFRRPSPFLFSSSYSFDRKRIIYWNVNPNNKPIRQPERKKHPKKPSLWLKKARFSFLLNSPGTKHRWWKRAKTNHFQRM